MGYQIRMAPQVEAWLAAVRDSDPAAADRIDEAVGALRAGGDRVGPPLVVTVDDPARSAAGPGGRPRGTGTRPDTAGPPRRSPHALAHWPCAVSQHQTDCAGCWARSGFSSPARAWMPPISGSLSR